MPKFYKQNEKRRDPRYFLNESVGSLDEQDRAVAFAGELEKIRNAAPNDAEQMVTRIVTVNMGNRPRTLENDQEERLKNAMRNMKMRTLQHHVLPLVKVHAECKGEIMTCDEQLVQSIEALAPR